MNYERLNDLRLLGLTIAYYRRAKGMTQAELAEADDPDLQFFFRHVISFLPHLKQVDFSSLTRKANFL